MCQWTVCFNIGSPLKSTCRTDEAAVFEAVALAEKTYQHVDGLILNAGTLDPLCRIGDDTPLSAWKTHFDINFFSLVTALKATLPALRKSDIGGKVVFVSSGAAVKGNAGWGPYNAGKAAMNGLCRCFVHCFSSVRHYTDGRHRTLAAEEPNLISVAVRPGMVDTEVRLHNWSNFPFRCSSSPRCK